MSLTCPRCAATMALADHAVADMLAVLRYLCSSGHSVHEFIPLAPPERPVPARGKQERPPRVDLPCKRCGEPLEAQRGHCTYCLRPACVRSRDLEQRQTDPANCHGCRSSKYGPCVRHGGIDPAERQRLRWRRRATTARTPRRGSG